MSIDSSLAREEAILLEQLQNGNISVGEYNLAMQELQRDARAYAEEEREERPYGV